MRKLLRVVLSISAIGACPSGLLAARVDCGPGVISNRPECLASGVYVGDDHGMPVDSTFRIALERSSIPTIPPKVVSDALGITVDALPNWYMAALKSSTGESECDVIVNGVSYSASVVNWLWTEWGMSNPSSELRMDFNSMGFGSQSQVQQAMIAGICEYSKKGRDEALKMLRERSVDR